MQKCIICNEKDKFNKEDIIPDALGGNWKINRCCEECNSKMGMLVDSKLTNNIYTELVRNILKISGRNGVPNPFKQLLDTPYNGIKGNLVFNKKGEYRGFKVLSKPIINNENKFLFVCDSNNIKDLLKAINKKVTKNNQHPFTEQDLLDNVGILPLGSPKDINVTINDEIEKDYFEYITPAIMKIAFETGWSCLGEQYLSDTIGSEMRLFLKDITDGKTSLLLPTNISYENWNWGNIERHHKVELIIDGNYIICYIYLLNFIKARVWISEQAEDYKIENRVIYEHSF